MIAKFSLVSVFAFLVGCVGSHQGLTFNESALQSSETSYSFGEEMEIGSTVADKIFTISKSAEETSVDSSVNLNSADGAFLVVSSTGCNRSLVKATDKCLVKVRFSKSKVSGSYEGTLVVGSGEGAVSIALTASVKVVEENPTENGVSLSEGAVGITSTLAFGEVDAKKSLTKIVTLTNGGSKDVTPSVVLTGDSNFLLMSNGCVSVVKPKKTCLVKLVFKGDNTTPENPTSKSASLAIAGKTVALTGSLKSLNSEPPITYSVVFENPTNTKTVACSGSETLSKIPKCMSSTNQEVDMSLCGSVGTIPEVTFNSPQGNGSVEVDNGVETQTCAVGDTSGSFVSRTCNSGFFDIDNGCNKFEQMAAASGHTCAVLNKKAYCWGSNTNGRLGDGTTTTRNMPTAVRAGIGDLLYNKAVTKVSTGYTHSCALAEGKVYCWGQGTSSQLGDGTSVNSLVPVAVRANVGDVLYNKIVTDVAAGKDVSCAVADAKAYCWGNGYLGDKTTTTNSNVPLAVRAGSSDALFEKSVTKVYSSGSSSQSICVIGNNLAYCWGSNFSALGTPTAVSYTGGSKQVSEIALGASHSCFLTTDGKMFCNGSDDNGQLGTNSTSTSTTTALQVGLEVSSLLYNKTVTSISAGTWSSCAIADGLPYCWGSNMFGKLGNGNTTAQTLPAAVNMTSTSGLFEKTPLKIISGDMHNCALANDGHAYCWGHNGNQAIGNGSSTDVGSPTQVWSPVIP